MSGQIHAEDTFVACSIAHNPTPYDHVYQISCVAPYWSLLQLKFCVFFYPPLHSTQSHAHQIFCFVLFLCFIYGVVQSVMCVHGIHSLVWSIYIRSVQLNVYCSTSLKLVVLMTTSNKNVYLYLHKHTLT